MGRRGGKQEGRVGREGTDGEVSGKEGREAGR